MNSTPLILVLSVVATAGVARAEELPRRLPPPVASAVATTDLLAPLDALELETDAPNPADQLVDPASWVVGADEVWEPEYEVGAQFNKGLFIRSTDLNQRPYSLYIGGRIQLRYIGFTRTADTWTDNTGTTRPIRNRNQFDVERARINFSGTALDPKLTYLFILDADGDGGSLVDGLAFYFNYEVDPALQIRVGRWKTAFTRQWLLSSRYQRLSDRSMATEFFRAGFSDGIWLLGDFAMLGSDGWHYETSLTNGLRTSSRQSTQLDSNLAWAGTLYCDPLGDYGQGDSDFACHSSPVVRYGCGMVVDKTDDRSDAGVTFGLGDDNFVRLSDGTRLADTGALAPGVTLLSDRLIAASFDFGIKYAGWSANVEYFIRSLQNLRADGPLPMDQIYTYGFHLECGKFLVPRRWDVNFRMSHISGMFGDSAEYAAGLNYYFGHGSDDRVNKFTLDVSRIENSAVNSTLADMLAGDDGVLFRAQVQIGF